MAREIKVLDHMDNQEYIIGLTKKETVELITLLSAQLAEVPAPGRHSGAAPQFIVRSPTVNYRLAFLVAEKDDG